MLHEHVYNNNKVSGKSGLKVSVGSLRGRVLSITINNSLSYRKDKVMMLRLMMCEIQLSVIKRACAFLSFVTCNVIKTIA